MKTPVRRATLSVTYNSANITADLAPMLLGFEYVDIVDGVNADSMTLTVENSDGRWFGEWLPERGATVTATLTCHDWPGGKVLECGKFEIDSINFAGVPNTCAISALAIGITSSLRRERKTRAWENISISGIVGQVAGEHGFAVHFDSAKDPKIDRFDQREQSDIEMLVELCTRNGLVVRISDKTLVVQEWVKLDSQPPVHTFERFGGECLGYRFQIDSSDTYSACEVQYIDPKERLLLTYRHEPGASEWSGKKPPSGYVLKDNRRCSCRAEAEILAKAALREANKHEATGTIDNLGNPDLRAGLVASVKGWGKFDDGRYMMEQVRHRYDKQGGYEVSVDLRGVLDY